MEEHSRLRQGAHERYHAACEPQRGFFEAASPGGSNALANLGASVGDVNRWHNEWQRHFDDERAATATCRKLRRALRGSLKAVVKVSPFVSREEATAKVMGRIGDSSD